MAKVKGALFSMSASGALGKSIVYATKRGTQYVRSLVIPKYTNTTEQVNVRDLMRDASQAWATGATIGATTINAAYKLAYATYAEGRSASGFNLFIRDCMGKNGAEAYDGSLVLPTEPGDNIA